MLSLEEKKRQSETVMEVYDHVFMNANERGKQLLLEAGRESPMALNKAIFQVSAMPMYRT